MNPSLRRRSTSLSGPLVLASRSCAALGPPRFWKAFRWFHAAVASPLLVVIVTGVGMKFAEGVAAGKAGSIEASIGTVVPAVVLICIAVVSPVALFKLLAFVDPGTASGASMRAGMQAMGGLQGLGHQVGLSQRQRAAPSPDF